LKNCYTTASAEKLNYNNRQAFDMFDIVDKESFEKYPHFVIPA